MEIKRDDPERRKNFRSRHGCDKWEAAADEYDNAYDDLQSKAKGLGMPTAKTFKVGDDAEYVGRD